MKKGCLYLILFVAMALIMICAAYYRRVRMLEDQEMLKTLEYQHQQESIKRRTAQPTDLNYQKDTK